MNKWLNLLLVVDLLILNGLVGFLVYKSQLLSTNTQIITNSQEPIDYSNKIQELITRVGDLELTPYPSPAPAGTSGQIKRVKNISYVNIPGNGETNLTVWTNIAGTDFYFDKAEYPGIQTVILEANIKLFNGSGIGSVRLLDVTHGIAVVGSEINTTSQSDVILDSGLLTIWSGENLYRIQAKSNSSDRLIYSWGKLKIVTLN